MTAESAASALTGGIPKDEPAGEGTGNTKYDGPAPATFSAASVLTGGIPAGEHAPPPPVGTPAALNAPPRHAGPDQPHLAFSAASVLTGGIPAGEHAPPPPVGTPAALNAPHRHGGPGRLRGVLVIVVVATGIWLLASRVQTGADEFVTSLGRIEVTARLMDRPEQFPNLGAYRYTYVLKYKVLKVHRQDPQGKYRLNPGDEIFVGHYKPWMPRSQIKDADWGDAPLGGSLDRFVAGEAHRLALDYEMQDLAPSGALDYCFPPAVNRFFAIWINPTTY